MEHTRRRRGVAISREKGIATSSSFLGCGEDFRCFFDFLVERLRDWRFASRISSAGDDIDMICGDPRKAEK